LEDILCPQALEDKRFGEYAHYHSAESGSEGARKYLNKVLELDPLDFRAKKMLEEL